MIDALRKDRRSKQWDAVIEQEKQRIAVVEEDHKRRVDTLLENAERRAAARARDEGAEVANTHTSDKIFLRTDYKPWLYSHRSSPNLYMDWSWQGVYKWAAHCDRTRSVKGFREWKGVPLDFLNSMSQAESDELFQDKRLLSRFYGGDESSDVAPAPTIGMSMKKIKTLEWSILKMSLRLLQQSQVLQASRREISIPEHHQALKLAGGASLDSQRWRSEPHRYEIAWRYKLQEANERLKSVWDHPAESPIWDSFPRPRLPAFFFSGQHLHDEGIARLISRIQSILQRFKTNEALQSALFHICQELLSTEIPPNIHIYNLLLIHFCHLRQDQLVWIVFDSINESNARPNEITHATLLRFFAMTNDIGSFSEYTKKMKGLQGGLSLAHPEHQIHPLVKTQFHVFGAQKRKVAIVSRMNQEVYSSLLIGICKFHKATDAMYWYRAMINEGWRPTAEILISILRGCSLTKDWAGGLATWNEFHKEGLKATFVVYTLMLQLCRVCGQDEMFHSVLTDGVRQGALTSRVLDLTPEELTGEVDALLEAAENNRIDAGVTKGLPPHIKKGMQALADLQGPHFVANVFDDIHSQRFGYPPVDELAQRAQQVTRLRERNVEYETEMAQVGNQIESVSEEVMSQIPSSIPSISKYTISLRFQTKADNSTTRTVLRTYDKLRRFANALEMRHAAKANVSLRNTPVTADGPITPSPDVLNDLLSSESMVPLKLGLPA